MSSIAGILTARGYEVHEIELFTTAGDLTKSITPSSARQSATFKVAVEEYVKRNGLRGKFLHLVCAEPILSDGDVDQPASGAAVINCDDFGRIVEDISWTLGGGFEGAQFRAEKHNAGPAVYLIDREMGTPGRHNGNLRAQIPTTDQDNEIRPSFPIFVAPGVMNNPADLAQPIGLFKNSLITLNGFKSTCLDGVSVGAVLEAVVVRCNLVCIAKPELTVGPLFIPQQIDVASCQNPKFESLGVSGQMEAYCDPKWYGELNFLGLTDRKGLGGGDGLDNVTQIQCAELGMSQPVTNMDAFTRRVLKGWPAPEPGVMACVGATLSPNIGYPQTFDSTAGTTIGHNGAEALIVPFRHASVGQYLSKVPLCPKGVDRQMYLTVTANQAWRARLHGLHRPSDSFRDTIIRETVKETELQGVAFEFTYKMGEKQQPFAVVGGKTVHLTSPEKLYLLPQKCRFKKNADGSYVIER